MTEPETYEAQKMFRRVIWEGENNDSKYEERDEENNNTEFTNISKKTNENELKELSNQLDFLVKEIKKKNTTENNGKKNIYYCIALFYICVCSIPFVLGCIVGYFIPK
jgi:hypothetical protein